MGKPATLALGCCNKILEIVGSVDSVPLVTMRCFSNRCSSGCNRLVASHPTSRTNANRNSDIFAGVDLKVVFKVSKNTSYIVLSKSQIKRITSLNQKKYRLREGVFVAEGIKVIQELLASSLVCEGLWVVSPEIDLLREGFVKAAQNPNLLLADVPAAILKKVSFLKTPQKAIALFQIPEPVAPSRQGLSLVLDDIRDPGNLGTIIRLCDWFGVKELICSKETVDCYNPKVVQATMGSLTRVNIVYTNLHPFLAQETRPVLGTFMDGTSVYDAPLPQEAVLVMGNEANGISKEVASSITSALAIPRFGNIQATESLNVATATAIFLSECRRASAIER